MVSYTEIWTVPTLSLLALANSMTWVLQRTTW